MCFLLTSSPISLSQVAEHSACDNIIRRLIKAIRQGWSNDDKRALAVYYKHGYELFTKDCDNYTILCRGSRIVVPASLQQQLLQTAHSSHAGVQKMKEIIRSHAWWAGMSDDIGSFVKRCSACVIHQRKTQPPPMAPIETSRVFQKLAVDLTGPSPLFDGAVVLTAIDYHSRYPFAFTLKRGTSQEIIGCLRHIFSQFGLPEAIVSDNGTPFVSTEFDSFLTRLGIKHNKSSIYFPQANGLVEHFHSTFKHRLARVRHGAEVSLQCAMDSVLFDIRATPAAFTGVTPFSRLFGDREMGTELSQLSHSPRRTKLHSMISTGVVERNSLLSTKVTLSTV